MPRNKNTEIVTVVGQSGSGKSSWVQKRLPDLSRFILFDSLCEYTGFDVYQDDKEGIFNHVKKIKNGIFQTIYRCVQGDEAADFDFICSLAEAVEDVTLIVEEVDQYATPAYCPIKLKRVLKIGRHSGISMVFVSRRPAEVNRLITAQSRRFICFQMLEPNDVRYMRAVIGAVADEIPTLDKLSYIDWNHGAVSRGKITW